MDNSPDISKVISLIMQNPEIIESLKGLLKKERDEGESPPSTDTTPTAVTLQADEPQEIDSNAKEDGAEAKEAISLSPSGINKSKRRNTLLAALKPYVSKDRAKAIDTMITIAEVMDAMKGG